MSISGNFPGCATGAFVNGFENLDPFQSMAGKKLAVLHWYIHWQEDFPQKEVELAAMNGSVPLLTWEPWVTHPAGTLEAIAAGEYDNYVENFFAAAAAWGKPLFLRFAHEMNGNWYPWDGERNGGPAGAEKYKRAWLHIHEIKEKTGAGNVDLVWCPNNTNQPDEPWNNFAAYYPGDRSVDWIGMDGYNWGYSGWQSFDSIFGSCYQTLTNLTRKPLMIGEFGSAEAGGDKAGWIKDAFANIKTRYPRIKLFCWFNINKERDWRIDSSPAAAAAFKSALQNDHFSDKML
jgi:beta-mannanase